MQRAAFNVCRHLRLLPHGWSGRFVLFWRGSCPQDLLQGFDGVIGGSLAAFFAVYLMLSFSPIVVPLRETLVRLSHEQRGQSRPI